MLSTRSSALSKVAVTTFFAAVFFSQTLLAKDIFRTFEVDHGGTLEVRTASGSINIETHDEKVVKVEIEVSGDDADDFEFESKASGDDVFLVGEVDNGRGWSRDLRVKFNITVPEEYELDLRTSGGSISIEDLTGNVDANTSGGSITLGNIQGDVDVHTSGGSITTEAVYGTIDAHTSGGSIRTTFAKQISKDAELRTSGGSITAYLAEDIAIDLKASTSGGRVKSQFVVDGRVKKKSIRGEINGGGPELSLVTSGGSIRIKKL